MFEGMKYRAAIKRAEKSVNELKSKVDRPALEYSEALANLANAEEIYANFSGKLDFFKKASEHYGDAAENIRYDKHDPKAHAYYQTYKGLAANDLKIIEQRKSSARKTKPSKLEKDIAASTGIGTLAAIIVASFAGSLLFLSPNLTGQAIGELSRGNCNFVGICLFLAGIAGTALYVNKRK